MPRRWRTVALTDIRSGRPARAESARRPGRRYRRPPDPPGRRGETVEFAIDGIGDTIDLDPKNAKAFRKSRDRYVAHATRTGGRQRTHITRPDPTQTRAIRELARANGFELADRGRIPTDIVQAYHASN